MIPELLTAVSLLFQQQEPEVRFGTTVYAESGFEGTIFFVEPGTRALPNLRKAKPVGKVYASSLNIPPQPFNQGFPGVTDRFEWFAIDYTGNFWFEKAGHYEFSLVSDDGSKLYIDGKTIIDNDGTHPPREVTGHQRLKAGVHTIRVSYFQGPRENVALVFMIAAPGEELHVFRNRDFQMPAKN